MKARTRLSVGTPDAGPAGVDPAKNQWPEGNAARAAGVEGGELKSGPGWDQFGPELGAGMRRSFLEDEDLNPGAVGGGASWMYFGEESGNGALFLAPEAEEGQAEQESELDPSDVTQKGLADCYPPCPLAEPPASPWTAGPAS
ncbi:MAG: hypothetical protein ACI8PZ_006906 [Myxococcota bacterium]|jgi:hypothetical protein